jgi:hypothetical protein
MEQSAVASAAATMATPTMAATTAAAATMTKGVGLRLEADHNDQHGRQSQHQLKYISLHQNYLRTHGTNGNDQRCRRCAIDEPVTSGDVLAVAAQSHVRPMVRAEKSILRRLKTDFSYRRKHPKARDCYIRRRQDVPYLSESSWFRQGAQLVEKKESFPVTESARTLAILGQKTLLWWLWEMRR